MSEPIKTIAEVVIELLRVFTWKKFFVLLCVAVLAMMIVVGGEAYSSHWELSRLQEAADIAKTLRSPEFSELSTNPSLRAAEYEITSQLHSALHRRDSFVVSLSEYRNTVAMDWLRVFVSSASVWWIVALLGVGQVFRRRNGALSAFATLIATGALAGLAAAAFPVRFGSSYYILLNIVAILVIGIAAQARQAPTAPTS